jgi:protein phosphatase
MGGKASRLRLAGVVRSDVGRRANNEDAAFASPRLVAVADGVGGAAAGEVASWAAIDALINMDKCLLQAPLDDALRRAVREGNARIGFIAECRPQFAGMSTTLTTVALANDGTYVIANVGDSRTYLLRDGSLRQLTRDDSFIQQLMDSGRVSADEARRHPYRNLVLEALDGDPARMGTVDSLPARLHDRLLLCSDGLSDVLDDETLADVLRTSRSADRCAERLVDLALTAGSRDNVTVIVADVVEHGGPVWPG